MVYYAGSKMQFLIFFELVKDSAPLNRIVYRTI